LGEQPSVYKSLSKYLDIVPINWNKIKLPTKKVSIVAGFSIGATLACDYAMKNRVKTLILCSMTPGVESLNVVKADKIIFLVGEKEDWVIKDTRRLMKKLAIPHEIKIVKKAGHKIDANYRTTLFNIIKRF